MATTLFTTTTTVKERKGARLPYRCGVTTSANDTLPFTYTINRHDFNADSWKQLGVRVEIDNGDGALVALPQSQRGPSLTIQGSLDGYGVREVSFSKVPNDSPIRSAFMRAPRRVKVTGIRGTTGGYREWTMLDGYLRDGEHEMFPGIGTFTAQDGSVLNEPLFYTLAARSYSSRRTVLADICLRYGIPAGTWTFTDSGNVGGYLQKEINEAGDRTVLQFIVEFLVPTTCRAYWRADEYGTGRLYIKHFDTTGSSKRTLTWSDIRSIRVIPPATNAPNTIRLTSEIYPYAGPDLTGTVIEETTTSAAYTTVVATHKQDHTTGVLSPLALSGSALGTRTATRTTTTYAGGTITAQTVETYGAYAAKACNKKLNADGTTRYNEDFDVYLFPDGSYRYVQAETWQVVSKTVTTRTFDAAGGFQSEAVALWSFRDRYMPTARYSSGSAAWLAVTNRYVTDDGTGYQNGREQLQNDFSTTETFTYDASSQKVRASFPRVFMAVLALDGQLSAVTTSTPADLKWRYGPTASYTYGINNPNIYIGTNLVEDDTITYAETSATSYTQTSVNRALAFTPAPYYGVFFPPGTTTVNDSIPRKEWTTATQVPLPTDVTTPSLSGAALTGKRLADYTEAGWCETTDEMEAAALEKLREVAAVKLAVDLDVDFDLQEGDVITLPAHASLGNGTFKVYIRAFSIDLDAESAGGDETLECWWYPPEVA